jgi:hypothetical protein
MLFQSLRARCLAPGGPGSIWNHLGAPVRSTGVCGRFGCVFRTDLHFADVLAIVIIVPEVLIQVGGLRQRQHQSFHRPRAF